jgi:hypothetical protein
MANFDDALASLTTQWTYEGSVPTTEQEFNEKIVWDETATRVTWNEVQVEMARLENLSYQKDRAITYPKIVDQLDMLWHAIDTGTLDKTSDFYTTLKAVKDQYPKSE